MLLQEHTISQQLLETARACHADEIAALQTEAAGLKQVPPSALFITLRCHQSLPASLPTVHNTLMLIVPTALREPPGRAHSACAQRVDASKAMQEGLQRELEAALEAQQRTHAEVQDRASEIEQAQVSTHSMNSGSTVLP